MKTTPSPTLPAAITQYFDAANRFDAVAAAACFTPDAVVRDEQKDQVGLAAIQQWIAQTSESARPHVTVSRIEPCATGVQLVGHVTGDFPGSPVQLSYDFRLQGQKIAQLTIQ